MTHFFQGLTTSGLFSSVLLATAFVPVVHFGPAFASSLPECASLSVVEVPLDYRLRNSTAQIKWSYEDNWKAHSQRAVTGAARKDLSYNTMGEINWTLTRWPNHLPVLEALAKYDLAGGRTYGFFPARCYFESARRVFPDDVDVVMVSGYWNFKKGRLADAEADYLHALEVSLGSAEAHYNLGLVYFEQKNYELARVHARQAYAAGHPLPGLRQKLERAGQWSDAP